MPSPWPLAFSGCQGLSALTDALKVKVKGSDEARAASARQARLGLPLRRPGRSQRNAGDGQATVRVQRPVHPVTVWRGRLAVALDALSNQNDPDADFRHALRRHSPMETTNVQLPTGDRLRIPTGAETLRLKGYLIMCRNSRRDFAEFADLVDAMESQTAAVVLASIDKYYSDQPSDRQWVATQLVRRLADPHPSDLGEEDADADAGAHWEKVRQRCLSVAVAMLEEAR
jgi:RND superfamily putative drug exporter